MATAHRPNPRRLRKSGARLDLRDPAVEAGGELRWAVVNRGRRQLLAGAGYGFEKRTALGWRAQRLELAFAPIGLPLSPGERTREMTAAVPEDFPPGRYRLTSTATLMQQDGVPVRGRDEWPVNVGISRTFRVT